MPISLGKMRLLILTTRWRTDVSAMRRDAREDARRDAPGDAPAYASDEDE